jgi:hypothetical protein
VGTAAYDVVPVEGLQQVLQDFEVGTVVVVHGENPRLQIPTKLWKYQPTKLSLASSYFQQYH